MNQYLNFISFYEIAYETDDTTLSDTDYPEFSFCSSKVLAYRVDFNKYGWLSLLSRCDSLNDEYNTKVRKVYYVHKDNLGSTIALTDSSGSIIQEYQYDVYGNPYVKSGTGYITVDDFVGNLHGNDRLFTGREYDREISLYYLRARYYDSEMGRFISRDPIGTSDDVNLYGYVGENPVMFVDLFGREKKMIKFDVTDLVLSIFEIAKNGTESNNVDLIYNTQRGGAYDLKRNPYIQAKALQNNGIVYFGGQEIEPSNLGNLLAGFNMENSNLSNNFVRSSFLFVEYDNATSEGYGSIDSMRIANIDEHTDSVWYDAGINLHDEFISGKRNRKIELITNAIISVTPEYTKRNIEENKLRQTLSH